MHRRTAVPVVALVVTLAGMPVGCGSEDSKTETVTVPAPAEAPPPSASASTTRPARVDKPSSADTPTDDGFVQCDANIKAKQSTTTCGFAQNVFWHYWTNNESENLHVYSRATKTTFTTKCVATADSVVCTTNDGGEVRFARAAVASYSQEQADAYASEHDLGPDPYESTSTAADDGDSDEGGSDTPGYVPSTDSPASPSSGENIPNYENGNGYRVQCADGMYSQSGGIQGACSGHGGISP